MLRIISLYFPNVIAQGRFHVRYEKLFPKELHRQILSTVATETEAAPPVNISLIINDLRTISSTELEVELTDKY